MAPVAARVTSPRFVGRTADLAVLLGAYERATTEEHASTVLVAGEAGVGKTRLVEEFGQRVDGAGGLVIAGACLEFDRALPFGPIVEALRELHRRVDDATLAEVLGSARSDLARLLPELAPESPPADSGDGDMPTARMFEHLLGALERLGDHVPTVFVIEDLHWADRSTRDLVTFLARNLRAGRVVVVGTLRSDDLHRRHPLRPVLAELERSGVARVDVGRFTLAELREQIAGILDDEPTVDLVTRIHDRSDGNAFFAEELLAATTECPDALSPSLRDLLLARVDALSDTAQRVLRIAAVIGRTAPHRLVVALSDRPEEDLLDGLREAVAHQVLVTDVDGVTYRFRHALVQEVVYEDLLPGERVHLHARLAQLLTDQPSLCDGTDAILANELACHWYSARDLPRALQAAGQAARVAEQMYAYPESLGYAERVLELWSQVPDAAELTGFDEVGALRYAARQAEMSGDFDRSLALVREANDRVDPNADPVLAGMLREREARVSWMLDHGAGELLPLNHEAVRLVPAEPPSEERAIVLASLGQQLMLAGRNRDAIEWCEQAIAVAQQVGARVVEGHARNSLGTALGHMGEVEAGLQQLHIARDIAQETNSWGDLARAAVNESGVLEFDGRYEEAYAVSANGIEEARAHGLARSQGGFLRLNTAETLFELGRYEEMEEHLREVDALDPIGVDQRRGSALWASLYTVRGQFDDASAAIARARNSASRESILTVAWCQALVCQWRGEYEAAGDIIQAVWLTATDGDGSSLERGCPFWVDAMWSRGVVANADRATAARLRGDAEELERAVAAAYALYDAFEKAQARYSEFARPPAESTVSRHEAMAALGRAIDAPRPELWRAAGDAWEAENRLTECSHARWREAQALLQAGERAEVAAPPLRAAHAISTRIGYVPLTAAIEDLARRARINLGSGAETSSPPSPADRLGLTAREREVLERLAVGRTNRQISDELFISTKTASVHVSNILAKLGVANRGEAGARARELGIATTAS
jgi:DNA-binding CsgD family transcriptional regulator/tetratricopeptide (TPR) repeat protein